MHTRTKIVLLLILMAPILSGCRKDENERIVKITQQHEVRQAEQNQRSAELQREVSAMQKEVATIQREVQSERAEIGRQRDVLETERRQIASSRRSDSLSAAAINSIGLILACLLPLGLALLLLIRPADPADDQAVVSVMLEDMVAERPLLFSRKALQSPPNHIGHQSNNGDVQT